MEIIDIKPRGYCKGVMRAILLAKKTRLDHPQDPVSILGLLVHNRYVAMALDRLNITTIYQAGKTRMELLDLVNEGYIILSAHGSSQQVKDKAKEKGLKVVDAVCEDVISTHKIVEQALLDHQEVLYFGKKNHPESSALIQTYPKVHLIETREDLDLLPILEGPITVTTQTTLSTLETMTLAQDVLKRYPKAHFVNEICGATRLRQEAVLQQAGCDCLIVVGDPLSNNTQMLAHMGEWAHIPHIFRIESLHDLDLSKLHQNWKIAITSGASTPNYLTNMVIHYLKECDLSDPKPFPAIDLDQILA